MGDEDNFTKPVALERDRLQVESIHVRVVAGPDQGMSAESTAGTLTIGTARDNDLVLTDRTVSRYHVELSPALDRSIQVHDLGSTNGTACGPVVLEKGQVGPGAELELGRSVVRVEVGRAAAQSVAATQELAGLRGSSPQMRKVMLEISRVAGTNASVLLRGESGTGKERAAAALHELSGRDGPIVIVDCGALSQELVASELFGHERGAFTGAVDRRIGAFERADKGTLFLDEVGELPADLQAKLLGALERRVIRRLGGASDIRVDVRVVSATHRDLRRAVNAGEFRLDLFYRLAVVTLVLPPLRERPEDVELYARLFADDFGSAERFERLLEGGLLERLKAHPWPGNVRELRNVVEATLALGRAPALDEMELETTGNPFAHLRHLPYKRAREELLERFEADYLPHLVERAEGNVSEAARVAGMDRSYLFRLLRKHDLR
ncbi:MAG: sigma 54-dependent Fis family transcriptional regulator [Deltaproteobacteria bacterium]|nr:sigma 54-dependent Fis family transcriptional regulator [Deltaproteobacteria bacterium]